MTVTVVPVTVVNPINRRLRLNPWSAVAIPVALWSVAFRYPVLLDS